MSVPPENYLHDDRRIAHLVIVGSVAERLAHDHLGRHPVGGADHGVPVLVPLHVGTEPKVRDLEVTLPVQQQVLRLQVPVHHCRGGM